MRKDEAQQIGELIGEVKGINERLDRFNGQIGELTKSLHSLPCLEHGARIKFLEKDRNDSQVDSRLDKSIWGGIKAQILGGLIGGGITGLVAWLTHLQGLW